MAMDLPDVEVLGPWTDGHVLVDGKPLDLPISKIGYTMKPGRRGGIPVLKLEIECGRLRIDHKLGRVIEDEQAG